MSAGDDLVQENLFGEAVEEASNRRPPEDHLRAEKMTGGAAAVENLETEWFCDSCDRRVTKSPMSDVEYGHAVECEYHLHPSGRTGVSM